MHYIISHILYFSLITNREIGKKILEDGCGVTRLERGIFLFWQDHLILPQNK